MPSLQLKPNLYWIGSLDPKLRVFDIIMETEFGTTYNSYVLKGSEKTALIETAKLKTYDQYIQKLNEVCSVKDIDYIVVNHTEPDHAGSVAKLIEQNPNITVVGTSVALDFLKDIVNKPFNSIVASEDTPLSLGNLNLRFIDAPNLHWPDTMYTYVEEMGVLFTCDSFGAHYCEEKVLLSKVTQLDDYRKALKYYYDMILGPFPDFMQKALAKIEGLKIDMIATGHGPVLDTRIPEILETYKAWSTILNPNPKKTVVMPYVSSYGYTEKMALAIQEGLKASGDLDVKAFDLVTTPLTEVAQEIYFADGILLGTPTILGDALKPLWDLTSLLFPVVHGNKVAGAFGSYGWSGEGAINLTERLTQLRMDVVDPLTIRFNPDDDKLKTCYTYGLEFGKRVLSKSLKQGRIRAWKCILCGEVLYQENRPEICPICGAPEDQFVEIPYEEVTLQKNTSERFLIVGAGAAAVNAAEAIRARNQEASIVMIGAENRYPYNRPQLTKDFLGNFSDASFLIKDKTWYIDKSIDYRMGQSVVSIDPKTKTVTVSNNETLTYDKLILAVGASCFIPPIKGSDKENVLAIRSAKDVEQIKSLLPMVQKVVVIGGGILGLEAAWQFKQLDKDVHILELAPALMTRQLDDLTSSRLRDIVTQKGFTVDTGVQIQEIIGSNWAKGIQLADGRTIEADLVIVSAGVKANTDLASAMGVSINRGILVDDHMKTSLDDVYAAGDCAEYKINYAIWPQAVDQGRVAGANAAGDDLAYTQAAPAVSMHAMDTELFALGDPGKDPQKQYTVIEKQDAQTKQISRYFFVDDVLVGGTLLHGMNHSIQLIEGIAKGISLSKFIQKVL